MSETAAEPDQHDLDMADLDTRQAEAPEPPEPPEPLLPPDGFEPA